MAPKDTNLTGVNLLLVFIYGGIFVVCVIIFLIRATRRSARFSQNTHHSDFYANKRLKQLINENLDKRVHYMYEPQLLDHHDERLTSFLLSDNTSYKYNYMYRMKALELMNDIDGMLTDISKELHRPVGKSILQHFQDVKSHSSGCLRSVRSSQIQALANMYHHARYSGESFTKKEYDRFLDIANNIIAVITSQPQNRRNKSTKKKGLQWQESVSGGDAVFAPLVENVEMHTVSHVELHGTTPSAVTEKLIQEKDTLTVECSSDAASFSNATLSFDQSTRPLLSSVSRRHSSTSSRHSKV